MALPLNTWNASYTFVAAVTCALVSVLAVVGSMFLLHSERVFADFDAELPRAFVFFVKLGLPGIAGVWLGFLAITGGMFLCERQKVAVGVVTVAAAAAGLYFFMMLASSLGIWFRITWFIM